MKVDFAKIANLVRFLVTLVTAAILAFVLYVSRDHITEVAYWMGLRGYQAETLFILVDIVALTGKVLNTGYFDKPTRRMGFKLMLGAGTASLACNVGAGILIHSSAGLAVYGAMIVGAAWRMLDGSELPK